MYPNLTFAFNFQFGDSIAELTPMKSKASNDADGDIKQHLDFTDENELIDSL